MPWDGLGVSPGVSAWPDEDAEVVVAATNVCAEPVVAGPSDCARGFLREVVTADLLWGPDGVMTYSWRSAMVRRAQPARHLAMFEQAQSDEFYWVGTEP